MRHLRRLGHSLIAGFLAGAALAPLQLLLWPEVSLSPAKALLALVAWGSWATVWIGLPLFGLVELAGLFVPYLASQRGFSVGLWRWLMIVVSLLVLSVAWWNREETRDLLLLDNRQALKVSGSIAAIYMITLLVLAIQRRKPWRAPLTAFGLGAFVVAALWVVWAATPVSRPVTARTEPPRFAPAHRLLFVSWEGTDLSWLLPEMERGDMPFLGTLWEKGAWGQLRTVRPYTRSAALATLLTGCAPAVHGVLGRRLYRVPWLTPSPVTLLLAGPWPAPHQIPWRAWEREGSLAPQRGTLWQILLAAGRTVGVVGWPWYAQGTWTVPTPPSAGVASFSTLDSDLRAALEPAFRAQPEYAAEARSSFALAAALGSAAAEDEAAQPVDALGFDTTLAAYLRPRWTGEGSGGQGEEVLHQGARFLDEQLRALWAAMGEGTLVVVVSPYGLGPPTSWQRLGQLIGRPRRAAVSPTNSPDGFVLFSGPGVQPGRLRVGRLVDVVPTVLYLLDLPVARDMAGRVVLEAVSEAHASEMPLRMISSYPPLPAPAATR
jgi:hypothetical protein